MVNVVVDPESILGILPGCKVETPLELYDSPSQDTTDLYTQEHFSMHLFSSLHSHRFHAPPGEPLDIPKLTVR